MSPKTVVKVRIGNDEYSLKSDRSEAYTQQVAAYVDRALESVVASGTVVETHKAAILAALAIADELFQAKKDSEEITARLLRLNEEMERFLPPAQRPSSAGQIASVPDQP